MRPAIDIILDGKKYAFRNWEIIPRVGDVLLLSHGDVFAKVTLVVWGDDSAAPPSMDRQWIQLVCVTTDKP